MRHGDKINNLGRKKAHRVALLQNLASQLITHKRIVTTLAKAKALRTYVEPLITKTKKNETALQISHNHRLVFAQLQVATRPGGYTRVLKLGIRPGDNAEKAMIELVDFNEIYGNGIDKAAEPAKKTRRAGGAKKKADAVEATPIVEEAVVVEPTVEETPVAEAEETPSAEAEETPSAEDKAAD